jgi:hypothetical protein
MPPLARTGRARLLVVPLEPVRNPGLAGEGPQSQRSAASRQSHKLTTDNWPLATGLQREGVCTG